MACYVEVDVNGEEVFWVDKSIVCAYSGRLSKLFRRSSGAKSLKVILHGLPGGPEALELIMKFCYNNGKTNITPTNTCLLYSAADFMEMTDDVGSSRNLVKQTETFLETIPFWTWSECVIALRQCEVLNTPTMFQKVVDSVAGRIVSAKENSSLDSSPETSCDGSTLSAKYSSQTWWFDDLIVLEPTTIEHIIDMILLKKLDHHVISRFLLYFLKVRTSTEPLHQKRKITELVICLLHCLDRKSLSCKCLFGILWLSRILKLKKTYTSKLEGMIGWQIDQATLDNLLVPSDSKMECLYDVNLVLRLLKLFLNDVGRSSLIRLKVVGRLVDFYLAEVAPDPSLGSKMFAAVTVALPDEARDCYDGVYRAIDMYIKVHAALSEEEKLRICKILNFEKLSVETCKIITLNATLPSRTAMQALLSLQSKLASLVKSTNNSKPKPKDYNDREQQIILYMKNLDFAKTDDDKLQVHIQGMQWRIMELEETCRKMQNQMIKMKTPGKVTRTRSCRSLPKMCS